MINGNDSEPENFLWQSFDNPRDTLLVKPERSRFMRKSKMVISVNVKPHM